MAMDVAAGAGPNRVHRDEFRQDGANCLSGPRALRPAVLAVAPAVDDEAAQAAPARFADPRRADAASAAPDGRPASRRRGTPRCLARVRDDCRGRDDRRRPARAGGVRGRPRRGAGSGHPPLGRDLGHDSGRATDRGPRSRPLGRLGRARLLGPRQRARPRRRGPGRSGDPRRAQTRARPARPGTSPGSGHCEVTGAVTQNRCSGIASL